MPTHPPSRESASSYPRADLGLPINMERLCEKPIPVIGVGGAADSSGRMASPVIVKALPLAGDPPGRAVPLLVVLNAPHVWDDDVPPVFLKKERKPNIRLTEAHLKASRDSLDPDDEEIMVSLPEESARDGLVNLAHKRWQCPVVTL